MTLNYLIKPFNIFNRNRRWLLVLPVCILCGCVSLPEKEHGIWPWEYDRGQGEPNTGDYVSFRAGVAKFGEPPKAVKPIKPESVEAHPPGALPTTEAFVTKAEPPGASQQRPDKANSTKKRGYDFTVREIKSTSANLLLDAGTPAYDIVAFNHGNSPVSVAIAIDKGSTQNASADKALPYFSVVPAHSEKTLVRFSAQSKGQALEVHYNSSWSIGDYAASHNCPEQYRFPFGEKIRAYASVKNTAGDTPYTRHAVVFSVPKGTPVLAARKGTVIQVSSDGTVDILHEDSTIGSYFHLEKIGEYIVVGQTVTTNDAIGIAGTSENNKDAYMQLTVWSPKSRNDDHQALNTQAIGFKALSHPIAFMSANSSTGIVLTKNQPVSRGKLPTSDKQTKRK